MQGETHTHAPDGGELFDRADRMVSNRVFFDMLALVEGACERKIMSLLVGMDIDRCGCFRDGCERQ